MYPRRPGAVLAGLLLAVALLAGCEGGEVLSGWNASGGGRDWQARFGAFEGSESRELSVGGARELRLDYRVEVREGSMTVAVLGADGRQVWSTTVTGSEEDRIGIPLPDSGPYRLTALGAGATGRFDLSWKTR
ncbi:MAG: hypothetical protein IBX62_10175 [Coriobacteriia bacterium]|nr:hypothetical protein [Coriobacteriia bacterium]